MNIHPTNMGTLRGVLASTALAAIGAIALGSGQAKAATLTSGSPFVPYGGYVCADVPNNDSTPGNRIQAFACHGGSNQEFELVGTSVLAFSGTRCMDVQGNGNGGALQTAVDAYGCTGGANQAWNVVSGQLVNAQYGYCLDSTNGANGTVLVVNRCNGSANQQWQFK